MRTNMSGFFNAHEAFAAIYETLKYEKFCKKPDETLHCDDEEELWCEVVSVFLKNQNHS